MNILLYCGAKHLTGVVMIDTATKKQLIKEIIEVIDNHEFSREDLKKLNKFPSQFKQETSPTSTKGKLGIETFLLCVDMLSKEEQAKIKDILSKFFEDNQTELQPKFQDQCYSSSGLEYVSHLKLTVREYRKQIKDVSHSSSHKKKQ